MSSVVLACACPNKLATVRTSTPCAISLPADKRASFSAEEIHLMRTTVNQLRNERLAKGQYTDAADDMLLKLF